MKLELAVALRCDESGVRGRPLEGDTELDALYGREVLGRIKIRAGDLVVVDREPELPQVVWRWRRGTVLHVEGDRAIVVRNVTQGSPDDPRTADIEVSLTPATSAVKPGDTLYFDGHPDIAVGFAAAVGAGPPALEAGLLADVAEAYREMAAG